jgi:TonB family protein
MRKTTSLLPLFGMMIGFSTPALSTELPVVEVMPMHKDEPDFRPYVADLQRRIKRAWFAPKGNESKSGVVMFTISPNGQMSDLHIYTPSGAVIFDNAALKAIENAAPFRPLPPGVDKPRKVKITFVYNVHSDGVQSFKLWSVDQRDTEVEDESLKNKTDPSSDNEKYPWFYLGKLEDKIAAEWHPPSGSRTRIIVVAFNLHKNGNVSDLKVLKTSGQETDDKAALRAIYSASPLPPDPTSSAKSTEKTFLFAYYLLKGAGARKKIAELTDKVKEDPSSIRNHECLGNTLLEYGDFESARMEYERALELTPNQKNKKITQLLNKGILSHQAFVARDHAKNARNFVMSDKINQSIVELELATQATPDDDIAWSDLGILYADNKDSNRASQCFKKALRLNSQNTAAKLGLQRLKGSSAE